MSDKIKHISDQSFQKDVLENSKPVIIDFWAEWCAPCRSIAPEFERLASEHTSIDFVKMNIDEQQEKPYELGIRGIPTFVLYKKGKEIDRAVGADPSAIATLVETATK